MRKNKFKRNIKLLTTVLSVFVLLLFITSDRVYGYIMPAEQLLDFMADNFSKFKTLGIVRSTLQISNGSEKVFKEQIWLKSPDLYNYKIIDRSVERSQSPDMTYLQLLMANSSWRMEGLLSAMGINSQNVAFTRVDGVIAYRIGENEAPRLIIEKERFIPLLLVYRLPEYLEGNMVIVHFQDYREQDDKWFPFEITYATGDKIKEKYTIQSLESNIPVDSSTLKTFQIMPAPEQEEKPILSNDEDERLRNIIRAFEEKYQ